MVLLDDLKQESLQGITKETTLLTVLMMVTEHHFMFGAFHLLCIQYGLILK